MDGKFVAYYRVSTDHQGIDGNGILAQRNAVEDYLNGGKWKLIAEFTEVESGKRNEAGKGTCGLQETQGQARYCQAR
jgi:DNA invertase Pin-like site-specific DNA recombinase